MANRFERAISPFSTVTMPEYIQRCLADGTLEAWEKVSRAFPGHPLLRPGQR